MNPRIGRVLGPVAAVATMIAIVIGAVVVWDDLGGPTVNAGEWFKANGITYRVRVLSNNRYGLVVKIDTKNAKNSPQVTGQAVFEIVARAGGRKFTLECYRLNCMYDQLQPGGTHTYTFQFAVTSPADSIEFVDTSAESPLDRVAFVKLRASPH